MGLHKVRYEVIFMRVVMSDTLVCMHFFMGLRTGPYGA
jgi:hypothetical protein